MRLNYYEKFSVIKNCLTTYLFAISKTFKLLNYDIPIDRFLAEFMQQWKNAISGSTDAMIIAEAKQKGINSILSDDSEFISFDGIKLYTANNIAISVHERVKTNKN
jgi:hypothetical protein